MVGGGLSADSSDVVFLDGNEIANNTAHYGGAVYAVCSTLKFSGRHSFLHNSGEVEGGH